MEGKWEKWVSVLKEDTYALYLASRDRRVPWAAKIVLIVVVAYALSPIDLIPDFIPVLGYLDDMILLPLGIALAIRLIPDEVWEECKAEARSRHCDCDHLAYDYLPRCVGGLEFAETAFECRA